MPTNTNQDDSRILETEITQETKKEIEKFAQEIKRLFQSEHSIDAFQILIKINTGEIETELTTEDLPLVKDKYGIKSIYHQLLDEQLITEANEFGSRCKTLGWDKSFHYEFLGIDDT